MKKLLFTLAVAVALWTTMFSPPTAPHVDFWRTMTASAVALCVLAVAFDRGCLR